MNIYLNVFLIILLLNVSSCKGQTERNVGGPCEDCEALLDYKKLNIKPNAIDTIPGFLKNDPKIKITGTVFQKDGKTPASDVVLYIYQVDRKGIYQSSNQPIGWEKRHGQHRTWLKTGNDGKYIFYTFRPASYPTSNEPEHIHIYVKEPNTVPYYLSNYLFESDPLLIDKIKQSDKNRGGSGVIQLEMKNDILTANRDIVLGLNIPNYD
ncbi:dioxygenase family protein [Galbibacter mesophilus]|uniref:dioxygenase family protein n=1 Tax=Galbibacter mesophilus TaxID=379069 RepID=UPI00191D2D68|nr:intradiol ring-cleavage dioxygenase [Galbibacter mesophilus]MCM5661457.1 intradiol ring-cleavage dioxygenase [Galbibacter mesophilus]